MKGSKKELLIDKKETPPPISLNQQQTSKRTIQQSES